MTLSGNATSAYVGDTIELTAILSDNANGETVYFYENENPIGTVGTLDGYAVLNHILTVEGNIQFTAECMHT